jgi:hypothetical protein
LFQDIYKRASDFQLGHLAAELEEELVATIQKETVCRVTKLTAPLICWQLLKWSCEENAHTIMTKCTDFILQHYREIAQTSEFQQLPPEILREVLSEAASSIKRLAKKGKKGSSEP